MRRRKKRFAILDDSDQARAESLRADLQAGDIPLAEVELAAYLGHEVAILALGRDPRPTPFPKWAAHLALFGRDVALHTAIVIVRDLLPIAQRFTAFDLQPALDLLILARQRPDDRATYAIRVADIATGARLLANALFAGDLQVVSSAYGAVMYAIEMVIADEEPPPEHPIDTCSERDVAWYHLMMLLTLAALVHDGLAHPAMFTPTLPGPQGIGHVTQLLRQHLLPGERWA